MSSVAVHLNDAVVTLIDNSRVLYREPGFALLEDENLTTGSKAFKQARINPRLIQHRYWSELSTEALQDSRFSHLTAADLASRQLEQMKSQTESRDWVFVVPSHMTTQQLGLLLGIANEQDINVISMIDSAVAATRRQFRGAVPVHVDIGLHSANLVRMSQPGRAQVERTENVAECGTYALFDIWLNVVAEAFVDQSRFDPLHTAATEQLLLNNLAGWLAEASRTDSVQMQVEYGASKYEAEIESLRLIGAVAPVYQQISSKLRALFRADDVPAVQVTDRVVRLPGLADMLTSHVGGEIFSLEAGATPRGALARCMGSEAQSGAVNLIRQLPWDQAAIELATEVVEKPSIGSPTHLLYGDIAYELRNSPLVFGSEEVSGGAMVMLGSEMPGVSRRHCSVVLKDCQCIVEDHSRYGTFLNGHKIDGSSILHIGDSIRIGSPGFEFRLITTDTSGG